MEDSLSFCFHGAYNQIFLILLGYIDIPGEPSQRISPMNSQDLEYDLGTTDLITGMYHKLMTLDTTILLEFSQEN